MAKCSGALAVHASDSRARSLPRLLRPSRKVMKNLRCASPCVTGEIAIETNTATKLKESERVKDERLKRQSTSRPTGQ